MSKSNYSNSFFALIKAIGEARSKQEEDRIVQKEAAVLKAKLSSGKSDLSKAEVLVRLLYCSMLGQDVEFAYINAVNIAQESSLAEKRVGYLTCSLLLHENHEFIFLLINTIQRDLKSTNHHKQIAALIAVAKLIGEEMIPAVLPLVVDLLEHSKASVRRKAVAAMHRMYTRSPDAVAEYGDAFRRALCDRDPSVMAASLCIFHEIALSDPMECKDLVPSFVSILKQVAEHRLSRDYEYHRVPAPWIQIKLLKLLSILGKDDQKTSEGMYQVLNDVIKAADTGINAGYAIIYECVRTICNIYPNKDLIETAANSITRLITSDIHNHKYLGITGLASIVHVNPKYAQQHQMVVIDALEDPDDTLKRKTLDLLYKMVTKANVTVIVDKKIEYLRTTVDTYLRTELVSRITHLAERYAPDTAWFIETMNTVFELGGDLVRPEVAHNLLRLLAEGAGGDEEQDNELRAFAVDSYMDLLEKSVLPEILIQVICWVVGEYSYLGSHEPEQVVSAMCELVSRPYENQEPRCWGITALMKICSQNSFYYPEVKDLVTKYKNSSSVDLQQRCYELEMVMQDVANTEVMDAVMPIDASCEDLEVDEGLSFLDWYVQDALNDGAEPYLTQDERRDLDLEEELGGTTASLLSMNAGPASPSLRFDAYETPQRPKHTPKYDTTLPEAPKPTLHNSAHTGSTIAGVSAGAGSAGSAGGLSGLNTSGVKRVWGKKKEEEEESGNVVDQTLSQINSFANQTQGGNQSGGGGAGKQQGELELEFDSDEEEEERGQGANSGGSRANSFAKHEPAKPAKTAEQLEKERLAAGLFAGLGGGGGSDTGSGGGGGGEEGRRFAGSGRRAGRTSAGSRRGGRTPQKKAQQQQNQQRSSTQDEDLIGGSDDLLGGLDLSGGGGNTTSSNNNNNNSSGGSGLDLLGGLGGGSNSGGNSGGNSGMDELDLLGGMGGGSSSSSSSGNSNNNNNSKVDPYSVFGTGDLLDLGGSGGTSSSTGSLFGETASTVSGVSMHSGLGGVGGGGGGNTMPMDVANEVGEAPLKFVQGVQPVSSNSTVSAQYNAAYRDDALLLLVCVQNVTWNALKDVRLSVSLPDSLSCTVRGSPDVSSSTSSSLSWHSCAGNSSVWAVITATFVSHAMNHSISCSVSYGGGSLSFTVPVEIRDLLRPFPMQASGFGEQWGAHSVERQVTVSPSSVQTPQAMQKAIGDSLQVNPIHIIQVEGISAGQILNTGRLVLIHAKVAASGRSSTVYVTLRSKDSTFCSAVSGALEQALA